MSGHARHWLKVAVATFAVLAAASGRSLAHAGDAESFVQPSVERDPQRESPLPQGKQQSEVPEIKVPAPNGVNRLTAGASIRPAQVAPGDLLTLFVRVRVAPGHYIYGMENSKGHNQPTAILIPETAPLTPVGAWQSPTPKEKDGSSVFSGDLVFQRRFVLQKPQSLPIELPIEIKYQVCNEALCWPPDSFDFKIVIHGVQSP